jgi:hypothetical protein
MSNLKCPIKSKVQMSNYTLPKLSVFSLLVKTKILDSCFRRNDDYQPTNENVIPVKTGIQKGLSLKIVLRIAQFRF